MKNNKISFETRFWAGFVAGNPFEAFDAIFDFAHLDYYKQNLSQAVLHCYKTKVYKQDAPCNAFVFYTAICSFLFSQSLLLPESERQEVESERVFPLRNGISSFFPGQGRIRQSFFGASKCI